MTEQSGAANGGKYKLSFSVSLPAIIGVIAMAGISYVAGYMTYAKNMSDLVSQDTAYAVRLNNTENLLTELKGDVRRAVQDIAEIKVYILPKK